MFRFGRGTRGNWVLTVVILLFIGTRAIVLSSAIKYLNICGKASLQLHTADDCNARAIFLLKMFQQLNMCKLQRITIDPFESC